MKSCPFCAEQIQDAAVVCRFCNRELGEGGETSPPKRKKRGKPEASGRPMNRLLLLIVGWFILAGIAVQVAAHIPAVGLPLFLATVIAIAAAYLGPKISNLPETAKPLVDALHGHRSKVAWAATAVMLGALTGPGAGSVTAPPPPSSVAANTTAVQAAARPAAPPNPAKAKPRTASQRPLTAADCKARGMQLVQKIDPDTGTSRPACAPIPTPGPEARIGEKPVQGWHGETTPVEMYLKDVLKDPDSMKDLECGDLRAGKSAWIQDCRFRAKNSFGGYSLEAYRFHILGGAGPAGAGEVIKAERLSL